MWDETHDVPLMTWNSLESADWEAGHGRARHDIVEDGMLPLRSLLVRRPRSDALVVHLHGSIDRHRYTLPRFERLASLSDIDANLLLLADPTLEQDQNLRIGWYVGRDNEDATSRLSDLIRATVVALGVTRVVIAGSSAGGFGAIALAPRLPDALAVAFSPQISISRYGESWSETLRRHAFSERASWSEVETDPDLRPRVDLSELYKRTSTGRVWYVQNTGDATHVRLQREPFEHAVEGSRVTFIDEFHCDGHNAPTRTRVGAWLERALDAPQLDPRAFALRG